MNKTAKKFPRIQFLHSSIEGLDVPGTFDAVTIGRAIHWLDRDTTLERLKPLINDGGHIVVCGSGFGYDNGGWLQAYSDTRYRWSTRSTQPDVSGLSVFKNTDFVFQSDISVAAIQQLSVNDLVNHSLSFSTMFDQVNAAREDYRRELEIVLQPFQRNGYFKATFVTWGNIFKFC